MNIVFFSHPEFLGSQSMPRFTGMIMTGMARRGHQVSLLKPEPYLYRIPGPRVVRKWFGYVDQFILFPLRVAYMLRRCPADTLFVFTDHALGPWVPLVCHRPHVIHCHDFLAQRSGGGLIPGKRTGWFGRCYQWYIRRGYRKGRYFVSVSERTAEDLMSFLREKPLMARVVYNGMNRSFAPHDRVLSRIKFSRSTGSDLVNGYLLHVGGNQWYKNRTGVIDIYDEWRILSGVSLPMVMVGKRPDKRLKDRHRNSPFRGDIHFISDCPDELVPFAYSGADVFLFPSIAEGFGWPIAEAMACGCPVITTDARPMTEVAGGAAFLIPVENDGTVSTPLFVKNAALLICEVLAMSPEERAQVIAAGLINAERFSTERSLDRIAAIYEEVLNDVKSIKNEAIETGILQ